MVCGEVPAPWRPPLVGRRYLLYNVCISRVGLKTKYHWIYSALLRFSNTSSGTSSILMLFSGIECVWSLRDETKPKFFPVKERRFDERMIVGLKCDRKSQIGLFDSLNTKFTATFYRYYASVHRKNYPAFVTMKY